MAPSNLPALDLLPPQINVARLDLVSLHLVLECASRGSISAAAPHCHLSVMGASERLRRLEELLGKRLFDRHRGGVQLTEAGDVVVRGARALFEVVRLTVDEVKNAKDNAPMSAPNSGRRGRTAKLHTPVE